MIADITDAPKRVIRTRQKPTNFYVLICMAIGSTAAIGAFHFGSGISTVDSVLNQAISYAGSDAESTRAGDTVRRQSLDSSWLRVSDIHLSTNSARQTVFNDQNYIPRDADNVIALRAAYGLSPDRTASEKVKLTIVRQSPRMKERPCWPYRQGRIESRNCSASVGLNHRD